MDCKVGTVNSLLDRRKAIYSPGLAFYLTGRTSSVLFSVGSL
jgi:hypothetical protein